MALTAYLAEICAAPTGAGERERARLHLLDWAGCAAAGAASPAGRAMRAALAQDARAGPLNAALMDGALGNVLEMDDVDKRAILHPGPVVIPAALAAAPDEDMDAVLDAIVRGYEAMIRVGRAVGPGHYAYWHNTGTCGPFGAAAAAASLLALPPDRTAHALGLAGTQASGFWQTRREPGSMAKQLHTARAAHAGLLAARLAGAGFDGPLSILEGPQGFFAATCPDGDPGQVRAETGAWRIHEVSFKPWPACRHAHAAIDAALVLREAIAPERIEQVEVATYPDAVTFCDQPRPQTVPEAKFSLQHAVAIALVRGAPSLADFEPAAFNAPEIRAMAGRVSVRAGPPFAERYPARYGAGLTAWDANGTRFAAEAPDALGDPENPVDRARLEEKAAALCAWAGWTAERTDALIAAASGDDLGALRRALVGDGS